MASDSSQCHRNIPHYCHKRANLAKYVKKLFFFNLHIPNILYLCVLEEKILKEQQRMFGPAWTRLDVNHFKLPLDLLWEVVISLKWKSPCKHPEQMKRTTGFKIQEDILSDVRHISSDSFQVDTTIFIGRKTVPNLLCIVMSKKEDSWIVSYWEQEARYLKQEGTLLS